MFIVAVNSQEILQNKPIAVRRWILAGPGKIHGLHFTNIFYNLEIFCHGCWWKNPPADAFHSSPGLTTSNCPSCICLTTYTRSTTFSCDLMYVLKTSKTYFSNLVSSIGLSNCINAAPSKNTAIISCGDSGTKGVSASKQVRGSDFVHNRSLPWSNKGGERPDFRAWRTPLHNHPYFGNRCTVLKIERCHSWQGQVLFFLLKLSSYHHC